MSRSADRAAKNDELFRDVNRNIARLEERFGHTRTLELICECEGVGCHDGLEIDSAAYADVRSSPLRFVVLPGHEDLQIEQVVLRTPTTSWWRRSARRHERSLMRAQEDRRSSNARAA